MDRIISVDIPYIIELEFFQARTLPSTHVQF